MLFLNENTLVKEGIFVYCVYMNIFDEFIDVVKNKKNPERATVVFLHGDLGSGKTTFTKNLCEYLKTGIDIQSPTFVILKNYEFNNFGFSNLIHIDAYRLESYKDLEKIKFTQYLNDKNNLIFIEWPEIVRDDNLQSDIDIDFKHIDKDNREIKIV